MKKRTSLLLALLVACFAVVAFALSFTQAYSAPNDTVMYSGTIVGAPTFNRPVVSATACTGLSGTGTAVGYHVQPFSVDTAGSYNFSSVQSYDGYLVLYNNVFDPANPLTNCLGGNDDGAGGIGTSEFAYALSAGNMYILVTTAFGNTDLGTFDNTISGPGAITLGTAAPPEITVAPGSLSANHYAGSTSGYTTTQQLMIGNTGELTLTWTITEGAASLVQTTVPTVLASEDVRVAPANVNSSSATYRYRGGTIILDEGFEGSYPPAGWTTVVTNNGDPTFTWYHDNFGPHSGTYDLAVLYDPALVPQNEWIVSPPLDLDSYGSVNLSFWSMGSLYWCRDTFDNCDLDVYLVVGAVGGGDDILVGTADDDWTANFTYSESTFDLSSVLPGGPVSIGFNYTGTDGAEVDLDDVIIEGVQPTRCDVTQNTPWLEVSPSSGSTISGTHSMVDVTFNSNGMSTGMYTGTLCVFSNDPNMPQVTVPITMTVGAPTDVVLSSVAGNVAQPLFVVSVLVIALLGAAGIAVVWQLQRKHNS